MIDCLMCPRAHLLPNKDNPSIIYCPFLAMQECIYGEHCIAGQAVILRPVIRSSRIIKKVDIPKFIPYVKRSSKYDWEALHEIIFTLWRIGKTKAEIAERVGIPKSNIFMYMRRYNE